jgi:hypothetical protein
VPHAYRLVIPLIAVSAALVLLSCGDSGSPGEATSTFIHPASATATQTSGLANEGGQAPVFYRTADDFASLTVDQPYKVVFRITNGFAADMLTVVASCSGCSGAPPGQTFQGAKVQPIGEEAAGSFYPVNLVFPIDGHWEVTVQATPDDVTIAIDVAPAP